MNHIILYGAGKALPTMLSYTERMDNILVEEIWDKDEKLKGKSFPVSGRMVSVSQPHTDNSGRMIIITASRYYKEIKSQLIEEFHIMESRIKDKDYIFEFIAEEIKKRYADSRDKDILNILEYLQEHRIQVFNGAWTEEFDAAYHPAKVFKDCQCGMLYTFWKGKRLYLKKRFHKKQAEDYIYHIMKEQDSRSPHCYRRDTFEAVPGDVVLDGGAAEGFFALECVDAAKHIYIIEGDKEWLEALEKTFEPYRDKVSIMEKWLGKEDTDEYITIDRINKEMRLSLIKMDIEGAEETALKGADQTMHNEGIRMIACTYHRSGDGQKLEKLMRKNGLETQFSDGYMFFMSDQIKIMPELRHGLIFGKRRDK